MFLDTVFIQAILNPRDQYHSPALQLFPRVKNAQEGWITEAIFMEVGNALSSYDRHKVAAFIQKCYEPSNISIVIIPLNLIDAVSSDIHFIQAGFRALLR